MRSRRAKPARRGGRSTSPPTRHRASARKALFTTRPLPISRSKPASLFRHVVAGATALPGYRCRSREASHRGTGSTAIAWGVTSTGSAESKDSDGHRGALDVATGSDGHQRLRSSPSSARASILHENDGFQAPRTPHGRTAPHERKQSPSAAWTTVDAWRREGSDFIGETRRALFASPSSSRASMTTASPAGKDPTGGPGCGESMVMDSPERAGTSPSVGCRGGARVNVVGVCAWSAEPMPSRRGVAFVRHGESFNDLRWPEVECGSTGLGVHGARGHTAAVRGSGEVNSVNASPRIVGGVKSPGSAASCDGLHKGPVEGAHRPK